MSRCRAAAAGVLSGLLAGCAGSPHEGYVFASTYDQAVRTIAVPVFDNTTFTPGLETVLTEAIIREIQASTPWRIAGQEGADTVLTGTLTDADLFTLTNTPGTGMAQEQTLSLTVDFTWRDNRTGEARVRRDRFTATSAFIPSRGIEGDPGERVEIGQRDAVDELAEAIVNELRADF